MSDMDIIKEHDAIPDEWLDDPDKLDECLKFDLDSSYYIEFYDEAWTTDVIANNKNRLLEIIKSDNFVPYGLRNNSLFLEYCLDKNCNCEILNFFNYNTWTDDIIDKYFSILYNYVNSNKNIDVLYNNSYFFKKCIEMNADVSVITKFTAKAYSKEIAEKYISSLVNKIFDSKQLDIDFKHNYILTIKCLEYAIIHEDFDVFNKFLDFKELSNVIKKVVCYNLRNLILMNNNVLEFLDPKILFLPLKLNNFEMFLLTKDKKMQEEVLKLSYNELFVFNRVVDFLRKNSHIDKMPIIYLTIIHLKNYSSFISNKDIFNITNEQLSNLLLLLQSSTNLIEINSLEDLDDINFEKKFTDYFDKISKNLDKLSLYELQNVVLLKRYRLFSDKAYFIYKRYCSSFNIKRIKKENNPNSLENILVQIYDIYNADADTLKQMFLNSDIDIKIDYSTISILESRLREIYAKKYDETLYKIDEKDKYNFSFVKNTKVKNKLEELKKDFDIYIPSQDFSMQIHSLRAYSSFENEIDNYEDSWNKPIYDNHGFCVTYVQNDLIGIAESEYPSLGFDSLEGDSYLLSGIEDIGSVNISFSITMDQPGMFLDPENMINNTKFPHNEQVRERLVIKDGKVLRCHPSYVTYIVDDINDEYNFMAIDEFNTTSFKGFKSYDKVKYFEKVKKCAKDMNLPIVVVDRLHYAKRERRKCNHLLSKFNLTLDDNILECLVLKLFNNLVGCSGSNKEYSMVFNIDVFKYYLDKILDIIINYKDESLIDYKFYLVEKLKRLINFQNNSRFDFGMRLSLENYFKYQEVLDELGRRRNNVRTRK